MKKILIFLGLILSINAFSQDTLSLEYVKNYVNKKMEGKIPGLAVSIVSKDSILWSKGFGYADMEMEKPFTNNTIIGIASISKVILGLAISTAQDEGLLDINEDINKYLPFKVVNPYHTEKDIITMSHLMTHTSTIIERDRIYCKGDFLGKDSPIELGDFLKDYLSVDGKYYKSKNFHDKKPGTIHDYSNIGAGLAAYIIEVTSGMLYNEYCKKYIFIPLQMENTGFLLSEVDLNNHAKHYKKYGKPFPYPTLTTYPDGGLRTSVNELSYFLLANINSGNIANENVIDSAIVNRTIKLNLEVIIAQHGIQKKKDMILDIFGR